MRIASYAKEIIAILAAGANTLATALSAHGNLTSLDWINISLSVLGATMVILIPNLPSGAAHYAKSIVAFSTAAATALANVLAQTTGFSHVGGAAWISVFLVGLGAIGLFTVPNEDPIEIVATVPASSLKKVSA